MATAKPTDANRIAETQFTATDIPRAKTTQLNDTNPQDGLKKQYTDGLDEGNKKNQSSSTASITSQLASAKVNEEKAKPDATVNAANWKISEEQKFIDQGKELMARIDRLIAKADTPKLKEEFPNLVPKLEELKQYATDFLAAVHKASDSNAAEADRRAFDIAYTKMIDHLLELDAFNIGLVKDPITGQEDLVSLKGNSLFWLKLNPDFIGMVADGKGSKVLEQTIPGNLFNGLGFGLGWSNDDTAPLKKLWVRMSREYALAAQGNYAEVHAFGRLVKSSAFMTDEAEILFEELVNKKKLKGLIVYMYRPKDTAQRDLFLVNDVPTTDNDKTNLAKKYMFKKVPPGLYYVKKNLEIVPIPLESADLEKLTNAFKDIPPDHNVPLQNRNDIANMAAVQAAIKDVIVNGKNKDGVPYAHKEAVTISKPEMHVIKTKEELNRLVGKDMHEDPTYKAIQQLWHEKIIRAKQNAEKLHGIYKSVKSGIDKIDSDLKNKDVFSSADAQEKLKMMNDMDAKIQAVEKHIKENEIMMEKDLHRVEELTTQLTDPNNTEADQTRIINELDRLSDHIDQIDNYFDSGLKKEVDKITEEINQLESFYEKIQKQKEALKEAIKLRPTAISGPYDHSKDQIQTNEYNESLNELKSQVKSTKTNLASSSDNNSEHHKKKLNELNDKILHASILNNYNMNVPQDLIEVDLKKCKSMNADQEEKLKNCAQYNKALSDTEKQDILKPLIDCQNYLKKSYQQRNLEIMPAGDSNQLNAVKACYYLINEEMKKDPMSLTVVLENLYALKNLHSVMKTQLPKEDVKDISQSNVQTKDKQPDNSVYGRFSRLASWVAPAKMGTTQPSRPVSATFDRPQTSSVDMVESAINRSIATIEATLKREQKQALKEDVEAHSTPRPR